MSEQRHERCDHQWELRGSGFVCGHCGRREGIRHFLDQLEARRDIDWQQRVLGRESAVVPSVGELRPEGWVEGLADQIEGEAGPVRW